MKPGLLRKRLFAWLFVLTFLAAALPSGASWQCLNGTPCPQTCLPSNQGSMTTHCGMASTAVYCAKCHATMAASRPHQAQAGEHCSASQCVLRVSVKASAALTEKSVFVPALLAQPPQVLDSPCFAARFITVSFPHPLVFYQQHDWRPYAGRAPPVLL